MTTGDGAELGPGTGTVSVEAPGAPSVAKKDVGWLGSSLKASEAGAGGSEDVGGTVVGAEIGGESVGRDELFAGCESGN